MDIREDNELVREVINGKITSFEVLVNRYQKTIFNLVYRMTGNEESSKDLTQDIFVKSFEKLGSFDFNYRFFSWIYRIAINETINLKKQSPGNIELQHRHYAIAEEQNSSYSEEIKSRILNEGLQELTDEYRLLILLKYFNGLTYEEIAETNDLTLKIVKSRLYMARERLQKILIQKGFLKDV